MDKKILLKDLVDTGTHIRKQIISKVRVTDRGVYPVGELWDANTTVDMIVNGASIAYDTLRETEEKLVQLQNNIAAEKDRAQQAEQDLLNTKADKADTYTKAEVDALLATLQGRIATLLERIDEVEGLLLTEDSVSSEHIVDGSIKLEDLSDEVTDKLQITVDEGDENVNFPG